MKLNRADGIGPSRRPELDQDDQPPAQRQRHEAPSAPEQNTLNLLPAPRRASSVQAGDSTAPPVRIPVSGTALTAEPHTAGHAHMQASATSATPSALNAGHPAPSGTSEPQPSAQPRTNTLTSWQASLPSRFRNMPRRNPGESISMYADRLLRDRRYLMGHHLYSFARTRVLRTPLSHPDRRRMRQMLVDAPRQGENESYAAYEHRRAFVYAEAAASILGTTARTLIEDLASTIDQRLAYDANTQNVASTNSGTRENTPGAAMSAAHPALPPQGPTHADTRRPDGVHQAAALAGPSGTAERQPGAAARTNPAAPSAAAFIVDQIRDLPPIRPGENNSTYAYRLLRNHRSRFVALLHQFASDRLRSDDARMQMTLATALTPSQQHRRGSETANEQRRDMLGIDFAAGLLNTSTHNLMVELASRIRESHPTILRWPVVARRSRATLAIDREMTRESLDMLTGMNEEVDLIPQTHPHTLAVIDHLGDIGSLSERALHPRVQEAVRTANTATQLVMNLRDMVTLHPDVLPARQRAQQRNRR